MNKFHIFLADARKGQGISQAGLSRLAGVSQPHISEIEGGSTSVTIDVVERLLEALGYEVVYRAKEEGGSNVNRDIQG